jgi:DNA-binding response OmpR family regulator
MARRIRVLIAEDDDDARNVYATYLQQKGMDVRAAADGLEALKLTARWKPDVAVLDLSMPKLAGDDVARQLRKKVSGLPILVISGYASFGEQRAREAGADEYCPKPCLPDDLVAIVKRLARRGTKPDA